MREPDIVEDVMALAERAAQHYVQIASRAAPPPGLVPQDETLPECEALILDEAGLGISDAVIQGQADPAAETVVAIMQMLASALTVQETASLLGVSRSRVRGRMRERSLAAIPERGRYLVPHFQFHRGRLIPAFARVFSATPRDLPLVVFYRWFFRPSPDLPAGRVARNRNLSPHQWLLAGLDPSAVQKMAVFL